MAGQITISIWFFILLVIIAVLALLDRILIPSTRWFFRRRINRVIDEIGTRLDIEIRPFQLTKRQVLIDRLVFDAKVVEEIQNHARQHDMPLEVVQKKVVSYAREIVPSFNAYLYFRIGYWFAKKIARLLYRVRVGQIEDEQYLSIDPDSTVVFVMNHRSNMDYVLVAFLAAERTTLSYAVGEWAKIWPLQMLIRAMGAFFVRRNSGNPLYRRVLERYIHMATREGVCQAVFLEGGLSRDGRLQPPKLGLIDYMLRRYDPDKDRDVVFIPVGINYDRILEDRSLLRTFDPAAEKRGWWFVCRTTFKFIRRSLVLMIFSRWRRYGYACVNFGAPLSAKAYCLDQGLNFSRLPRAERFPEIEKLCHRLMSAISEVVPVLPVSLMSTIFLGAMDTEFDILDIEDRSNRLINELQARGAPVFEMSRSARAHDIVDAIGLMTMRRMVTASGDQFKAVAAEEAIMRYYANTIGHWRQDE
ncbi:MAG: 1-acyl-sn-glycerol-3-phosphate acyltransferase [Desulfobacterales bacterium]|jgi:glycerol-3-phosphate O-acyltransferase